MKKVLLSFVTVLGMVAILNAQDLTDKKGRLMLPEGGDWGISVEATPFINVVKDMVHIGAAGTHYAPTFNGLNNTNPTYSIAGKYFIDNTTAYRGIVRIFNQSNTNIQMIDKMDISTPTAQTWPNGIDPEQVKDKMFTKNWAVGVGAGIEKRKGSKYRIQGYYGGEASIILAGNGNKYKYGNELVTNSSTTSINDDGVAAYSTNFGANLSSAADHDERTLVERNGKTVALAVRGFVGVEYFVLPKMSIGGEFGWGFGYALTGRGSKTVEGIDWVDDSGAAINGGTVEKDIKVKTGNKTREFFFGSDRDNTGSPKQLWMNSYSPAGNLSLNFYF